jgi:hypothetical protein
MGKIDRDFLRAYDSNVIELRILYRFKTNK